MKVIVLTPALADRIQAVRLAESTYFPGRSPASVVEIPRLALAEALLEAITEQDVARIATLAQVPKARAAQVSVIDKRRRRQRRSA